MRIYVTKVMVHAEMKCSLLILIVFFVAFALFPAQVCGKTKNILILHSYHQGLFWTDKVNAGMVSVLEESGIDFEIHVEYMDTKRLGTQRVFPFLKLYFEAKYCAGDLDLILLSDNNALAFIMENKDLFKGVPVVFCGINGFRPFLIEKRKNITGITEKVNIDDTIKLALKMCPNVKRVVAINDLTTTGMANQAKFERSIAGFANTGVSFEMWNHLSAGELEEKLANLGDDSLVLLFTFHHDKNGQWFSISEFLKLIIGSSRVPVFTVWDHYLGHGVAGGVLISGFEQGRCCAGYGVRILSGEPADSIEIMHNSPNVTTLDLHVLRQFGISPENAPSHTVFINNDDVVDMPYGHELIIGILIFILLILAVLGASGTFVVRRTAEKALVKSEKHLSTVYEAADNVAFITTDLQGEDSVILSFSPGAEKIFGYTSEEVVGEKVAILHMAGASRDFRGVQDILKEKGTGYSGEEQLVRKGGETFPALINVHPVFDENGEVVEALGVSIDITERKKAEDKLFESEEKFRAIFNNAPEMYASVSPRDDTILMCNETLLQKTGFQREELVGAKCFDLYSQDCRKELLIAFQEFLDTGYILDRELVLQRKDGSRLNVSLNVKAVRDEQGDLLYTISSWRDISARKMIEEERDRLISAIEQAAESIVIADTNGIMQYVNPAFEKITGYTSEEAIGQNVELIRSSAQPGEYHEDVWATINSGAIWTGALVNRKKDGTLFTEEAVISPVRDPSGRIVSYVAVKRDITKEIKLEEQLRQAQKLESVGRLAGGVAHDYNNALSVVMGFTQVAMNKVEKGSPVYTNLEQVIVAAQRAADVTKQLLAFARKQTIDPVVLDLNSSISDILKMLSHLLGEDIQLVWKPARELNRIEMDPSQVDQILANLCINARDAIDGVGRIQIETSNVTFDKDFCKDKAGVVPGSYVHLSIVDNGSGMSSEVMDNIFEPFFTTKGVDEGTGLGLATVYGIVKQNRGFINVASEEGTGTVFNIYFPAREGEPVSPEKEEVDEIIRGNGEVVIVVEDDTSMLRLLREFLKDLKYDSLCCSSPVEAVEMVAKTEKRPQLLISDVVLPEMNGKELSLKLLDLEPELKVVFMSGHPAKVVESYGVLDDNALFIEKPFTKEALALIISEALRACEPR